MAAQNTEPVSSHLDLTPIVKQSYDVPIHFSGERLECDNETLQQYLDCVVPFVSTVAASHEVQATDADQELRPPMLDEEREKMVATALKRDIHGKNIRALELLTDTESSDLIRLYYVYTDRGTLSETMAKTAEKALFYTQSAIADARRFFPFTDRIVLDCIILPVDEQDGPPFQYHPLLKETYRILNRRGFAGGDEGAFYIFCFPFDEQNPNFEPDPEHHLESSFDWNLAHQIRHETTHIIMGMWEEDSDFASEAIAMLMQGLHDNSTYIHAKVRTEDIDLEMLNRIAELRSGEGQKTPQHQLYHVSHSLFRFIYDCFDQNADKFGDLLDLMRTPHRLSLSQAFEHVFKIPFIEMTTLWEHELFRSTESKKIGSRRPKKRY
jgi:hypothetical protein